ncbi:MAG: hypothetical protein OXO52_03270, partial [Rhodospirillales bacterium]|nr:hypothetical protein [Rhodospirillales bacterium]
MVDERIDPSLDLLRSPSSRLFTTSPVAACTGACEVGAGLAAASAPSVGYVQAVMLVMTGTSPTIST